MLLAKAMEGALALLWLCQQQWTSVQLLREAYRSIAGRDIAKLSALLSEDLQEVEAWIKKSKGGKLEVRAKPEMEFHIKNMRETVERMKKYLGKGIGKKT